MVCRQARSSRPKGTGRFGPRASPRVSKKSGKSETRPSSGGKYGAGPPPKVAAVSDRERPCSQHREKPAAFFSRAPYFKGLPAGSLLIRYRQKTPGHLLGCEQGRSRSEKAATLGGDNRLFRHPQGRSRSEKAATLGGESRLCRYTQGSSRSETAGYSGDRIYDSSSAKSLIMRAVRPQITESSK
jgi:hypothetical protein